MARSVRISKTPVIFQKVTLIRSQRVIQTSTLFLIYHVEALGSDDGVRRWKGALKGDCKLRSNCPDCYKCFNSLIDDCVACYR